MPYAQYVVLLGKEIGREDGQLQICRNPKNAAHRIWDSLGRGERTGEGQFELCRNPNNVLR